MLTPATTLTQGSPTANLRRTATAPAVNGAPKVVAATNGRSNDQLNLSQTSQARNPYQGTAPASSTIKVDPWGKGKNDSVVQILLNQGFTQQEIYGKSGNGKTLLDEVTRVNGLRNANMIQAGQDLVVPSKQAPEEQAPVENQPETATPETRTEPPVNQTETPRTETPVNQTETPRTETPVNQTETPRTETPVNQTETPRTETPADQTEQPNEPKVNDVKVDRWGQGPNSSLGAILKSQGFDDTQIYREDANGDSLLKKVARANGLESPDKIFAGSMLNVPNSMEALGQMDIPEMPPKPEPPARVETPTERTEVEPPARTETPGRTETPRQPDNTGSEPTANMGMLLDGVKSGDFTRQEFQYLNARSSRYSQMRARYSDEGYSNDELKDLGQMERRYGVEFARLSASDDVALPQFPRNSSNPDLAIQVKHYHESGPMYDGYSNGTMSSETAIQRMVRQRDEARQQEVK